MIKITDIKIGSAFSEQAQYVCEDIKGDKFTFYHLTSNKSVTVDSSYIQDCFTSADQYSRVVTVGLEDKYYSAKDVEEIIKSGKFKNELEIPSVGSVKLKGIRSVFKEIPSGVTFKTSFRKQGKTLSEKQVRDLKSKQIAESLAKIEEIQKKRKGVLASAKEELIKLLDLNIESYVKGDVRELVGYKLSNIYSSTGYYDVFDLEFPDGRESRNHRQININTLESVIFDGVLYQLEK